MNDSNDMAILNGEAELPNDGSVAPLDGSHTSLTTSKFAHFFSLRVLRTTRLKQPRAGNCRWGLTAKKPAANVQEALGCAGAGAEQRAARRICGQTW